jgi:hypothetical protein
MYRASWRYSDKHSSQESILKARDSMAFFLRPGYFDDHPDDDDWKLEPLPVDEEYVRKATGEVLDDESPFPVVLTVRQMWLLLCASQLATRQDDLSQITKSLTEEAGRLLQAEILVRHPSAEQLAEMGWDSDYDR